MRSFRKVVNDPVKGGKSRAKSSALWDQGRPRGGRDLSNPVGGQLEDLFWVQTSFTRDAHQKKHGWRQMEKVQLIAG